MVLGIKFLHLLYIIQYINTVCTSPTSALDLLGGPANGPAVKRKNLGDLAPSLHKLSSSSQTSKWPSFITLQSTQDARDITKLSRFALQNGVELITGSPVSSITSLRSGGILVKAVTQQQSKSLLNATMFIDIPIKAEPHKTLNTSRGILRCRNLRDCTDEEISTNLAAQGVTLARRIITNRHQNPTPTNTIILTFDSPSPPAFVTICYEIFPVEQYIPNPLRCSRCQQYGHHHTRCNPSKPPICAVCGESGHSSTTETPCSKTPNCFHCKGSHTTYSKECPTWSQEKQIITLKTTLNIPFPEARKRVTSPPQSFASAANSGLLQSKTQLPIAPKPVTRNQGTQCQLFHAPALVKWSNKTPTSEKKKQDSQSQTKQTSNNATRSSSSNNATSSSSSNTNKPSRRSSLHATAEETTSAVDHLIRQHPEIQNAQTSDFSSHNMYNSLENDPLMECEDIPEDESPSPPDDLTSTRNTTQGLRTLRS